ncbi:MAG: hypothetical protein QNJ77_02645 [Acidimicrobiia bacterium]|nr:hypothetical protein [Acidimicrobiia bacterium]
MSTEFTLSTNVVLRVALDAVDTGSIDEERFLDEVHDVANHLEALLPDLIAAYDRAMRSASDDELANAVQAVRDFSFLVLAYTTVILADVQSVADVAKIGTLLDDRVRMNDEASAAAVRGLITIDEYAIPHCGFGFSE